MDALDRRLLDALQRDASGTNAALAEECGLSPSSCLRRVQRLKAEGYLTGTVALADADRLGRSLTAIVEVVLELHAKSKRGTFLADLEREASVTQAWTVTGDPDMVLILRLKDMKEYADLVNRIFDSDPNVLRFRTLFVMSTHKDTTVIPTDALP
ncbi:MAG: Lrp/AsnC family transcriptional regulator [Rhodospirillum sp.]|nr:Lrp/AsnC family transcriptional regulator [Rhodospirillum sp.]MCF8487799.1 Lrp/AsnC family transcriptional regulator [Rhodospirillum sp.]MCF8499897.1 Lrp/AsnC family transcriptional regulator [Rhodospirillum sp.]